MPRTVKRPLIGAIACLLALVPLAIAAYKIGPTSRLDNTLLLRMARPESSPLYGPSEIVRLLGELPVVVLLVGALVVLGNQAGRRREALAGAAVVIGAGATTQILKHVFAYPRFENVWWTTSHELAFPSGHTTAVASLSIALVLVVPQAHRLSAAAVGVLATGAVAIAVMLLGWHYPSDVLGGLLVASAWGLGAVAYLRFRADHDGAVNSDERSRPRNLVVSIE